jgi:hypothetical protein
MSSSQYRSIYPVTQRDSYDPNTNVDFVLNLNQEKLVPGTIYLQGECQVYSDGITVMTNDKDLYYDGLAGYHGVIRDIQTEFKQLGVVESIQNYPRLVKMKALALSDEDALGCQADMAVEGRVPSEQMAKGYLQGSAQTGYVPFSLKVDNVLNNCSAPVSSSATGQIRLRFRIAPSNEFLFGEQWNAGAPSFVLRNLKLHFQAIPDDGQMAPVQMVIYSTYRGVVESTNQNLSTFVPGPCSAVHMSFLDVEKENDEQYNFLACAPPPGKPPLGDNTSTFDSYGFERVQYAINDTDTALTGFTIESREEILKNGLRSFDMSTKKYNSSIQKMMKVENPDGYLAGIAFGNPINLQNNKFAVELQSQVQSPNYYAAYFYFRMPQIVQA